MLEREYLMSGDAVESALRGRILRDGVSKGSRLFVLRCSPVQKAF